MNPFNIDNAPSESNYESHERSKQRQFIVGAKITQNDNRFNPDNGIVRGATINQNSNNYHANSNGGAIQGAVINQTGNSFGTNSHNCHDHEQKSVATDSNQQSAEELTNEDDSKNSVFRKDEEVKSSHLKDLSTTDTSKTDVNKANVAQPETQLPQSENVDNSHGQNTDHHHSSNNNHQRPGVGQLPTF